MTADSAYRPLLPPREAARILGVGLTTLRKITAEGRLPEPVRISDRRVGYRPADLDEFMRPSAPSTGSLA
ncbi:helix-turn-helix transcriptional regulator [Methylobacterium sp. NPDC080182]|uniref:helix-turn-helix transcriptional regulator n=1 Tax=Methylobacterium sp. NPDC080182 TaxID=3390590 RepID=UPI003D085DB8